MGFTKLIETINLDHALRIASHTPETLSKIFNGEFQEYETKIGRPTKNAHIQPYTLAIKMARQVVKNNGKITAQYNIRKSNRNYATNSIQQLKKDIRGYLLFDYLDFDIINCLPTILLYLAKSKDLTTPNLSFYVNKRDKFLKKYSIDKQSINIIINSKNNKKIPKKLGSFREEIEEIAGEFGGIEEMIAEAYAIETHILIGVYDDIIKYEICEKDGFYLNIQTLHESGLSTEQLIIKLNEYTEKYGIKWKNKEMEGLKLQVPLIDIAPEESKDYEKVKSWLDEQLFLTKSPPALWYKTFEENGKKKFRQIKIQEANMIFKPYTFIDDNNKEYPILPKWLEDKERKTYEGIVFKPYGKKGKDISGKNFYNTFEGFDIWNEFEDIDEFIESFDCENKDIYLECFLEYIIHLTGNDKEKKDYVINWISYLFQYPNKRPDTYLLLKGEQGAGKDTLFLIISMIIGDMHSYDTENPSRLLGNFNADLEGKIFTAINELKSTDGFKYSSDLKAMITNNKTTINQKNEKTYRQENFNHYMFLSNQEKPTQIESTDRRAFVCNTGKDLLNNREYWTKFYGFLKNKNYLLTIYQYLMRVDLKDFEPRLRPITKEMNIMKAQNIPQVYSFLKKEGERLIGEKTDDTWKYHEKTNSWICLKKNFKKEYTSYLTKLPYYEDTNIDIRKKWKHFDEEGQMERISDVGFIKKKVKRCDVNSEVWIFEPEKLLAYFDKVNMFPVMEEDIIELDDEFMNLLEGDEESDDEF